jgi:hypothetical protein
LLTAAAAWCSIIITHTSSVNTLSAPQIAFSSVTLLVHTRTVLFAVENQFDACYVPVIYPLLTLEQSRVKSMLILY